MSWWRPLFCWPHSPSLGFLIYNVTVLVPISQGHWDNSQRLANTLARGSEKAGWMCPERLLNAKLYSRCPPPRVTRHGRCHRPCRGAAGNVAKAVEIHLEGLSLGSKTATKGLN